MCAGELSLPVFDVGLRLGALQPFDLFGGNVTQFPMPVYTPQGKGGPTERLIERLAALVEGKEEVK